MLGLYFLFFTSYRFPKKYYVEFFYVLFLFFVIRAESHYVFALSLIFHLLFIIYFPIFNFFPKATTITTIFSCYYKSLS